MRLGIMSKVGLMFAIMGVLLVAGVGYASYSLNYRQVEKQYTQLSLNTAKMAAKLINGDSIARYLSDGEDDEYRATYDRLCQLGTQYGIKYLYVLVPVLEHNDAVYVFDALIEGDNPELIMKLGDTTGWLDVYDIVLNTYLTGQGEEQAVVTTTKFGYLSSAYVPLYASDRSITAIIGVDISMDKIMAEVLSHTIQIAVTAGIVIVLFLGFLLFFINRQILYPIKSLSGHMETFTSDSDELSEIPVMRTGDELQSMCSSFNRMVGDLRMYIKNLTFQTQEKERIASDLRIATDIQADMLPKIFPPFSNRDDLHMASFMLPAKEVGGDFYDFFFLDDAQKRIALVVADVSGKGVPAALFMVIAKILIKNNKDLPCDEILNAVNNLLAADNNSSMFVTTFFSVVNLETGEYDYASAGHNPPALYRKESGEITFLQMPKTPPLAIFPGKKFSSMSITLKKGDVLLLYTDGVTEAFNTQSAMYGSERLTENLRNLIDKPVEEIVDKMYASIKEFAGDEAQSDDITMLCCRYLGK